MTWSTKTLLAAAILLQSLSALAIKYAALNKGLAVIALLGLGVTFLSGQAIAWQHVLRKMDLSHAYPATALAQVLIFLYAVLLFGEKVGLHHILGFGLMLMGLAILIRRPA